MPIDMYATAVCGECGREEDMEIYHEREHAIDDGFEEELTLWLPKGWEDIGGDLVCPTCKEIDYHRKETK